MERNDEPADPFAGLEDWAEETEKRVRKQVGRMPKPATPARPRSGPGALRSALLVAAAAVAAVVLAWSIPRVHSLLPSSSGATQAYPTASVPSGVTVTTSPKAAATDPFAGTPAAHYPKAAAGITMPAAAKAGGFSAAQVRADLQQVRAAMIAGRLDRHMIVDHRPDKFLALLAPNSSKDIQTWFRGREFTGVATWIDPKVHLEEAEPPRVSGRITYRQVIDQGIPTLRVTTNFIWVYAFTGPAHPIAAEHDQIEWDFPADRQIRPADRGMWIRSDDSYGAWVDCVSARRGLFAPTPAGALSPQSASTEDPENYLRADHSLDIGDDCGTARKSAAPSPG